MGRIGKRMVKIGEVSLLTNDVRKLATFYKQLFDIDDENNDETHQFIITSRMRNLIQHCNSKFSLN